MSLDLFQRETAERVGAMPGVTEPDTGVWDGFMRGTGLYTLRGLARVGRSVDLLGSVMPIAQDAVTGGTTAQDKYFQNHDDVWGSAVDYWTPKPGEVGVAGEVTGQLISMLPLIIAPPLQPLAIADTQIGTAEDLVKKGVGAGKAQAVGALQGAGLGLGVWMPILGQNLWQRVVVGGMGFNVLQGITTRAGSQMLLQGTEAAKDFEPFDGSALTLDALLGAAFGGVAHIHPEARAQGKAAWERIDAWAQGLNPSDVAALATLRTAQHMNVDSTPGKPADAPSVDAHVARTRQAIEQLVRGEPVAVDDLAPGEFKPDPGRVRDMMQRAKELADTGERVRTEEGLPPAPPDLEAARADRNLQDLPPDEQAAAIGTTVREQLERTGMAPEEATANAALWEHFFRTAAEKYGTTAGELMGRYGVDIRRLKYEGDRMMGALEQTAYHGSANRFDEFSLQKIGTGEGAQAYGWGLYFTSKADIAKWYRNKLTKAKNSMRRHHAKVVHDDDTEISVSDRVYLSDIGAYDYKKPDLPITANWRDRALQDIDAAEATIKEIADERTELKKKNSFADIFHRGMDETRAKMRIESARRLLERGLQLNVPEALKGTVYKADIPEPETMLDWNKPVAEQSDVVRAALERAGVLLPAHERGSHVYIALAKQLGGQVKDMPAGVTRPNPEAASRKLAEAGITGIRYKGDTSGENNFVVFDDKLIKVREFFQSPVAKKGAFYSELERQLGAAKMEQAPAKGWKDLLKSFPQKGVRAEELKWSGIEEWLDLQQGKVTKAKVLEYVRQHGVKVEEIMLGSKGERTLGDQAIAREIDALDAAGFDVEVDPTAHTVAHGVPARLGFHDRDSGDIVVADDIRRYANDQDTQLSAPERTRLTSAAAAAERVERYWYDGARPNANADGDNFLTLVQQLEDEGYTYAFGGTADGAAVRRAGLDLQDGDLAIGMYGPDGTTVQRWVRVPEDGAAIEGVPMEVRDIVQRMIAADTAEGMHQVPDPRLPEDEAVRDDVDTLQLEGFMVEADGVGEWYIRVPNSPTTFRSPNDVGVMGADLPPQMRERVRSVLAYLNDPHATAAAMADVPAGWREVEGGPVERPTKFGQYQLPGGKNYRELLLTLPHDPEALPKGWEIKGLDEPNNGPSPLDALTDEYQAWSRQQNLPAMSADEMRDWLMAHNQRPYPADIAMKLDYLERFIERWDAGQEADSRRFRYTLVGPDNVGHALHGENPEQAMESAMKYLETSGQLDKGVFRESHWELSNVLAHVRFNERLDAEGKKVLFVEEIQSDWAQKGKKRGFTEPHIDWRTVELKAKPWDGRTEAWEVTDANGRFVRNVTSADGVHNEAEAIDWVRRFGRAGGARDNAVPAGPFVGKTESWVGLVLKRMIAYGAERGFDRVAWTTGEQQTSRYTQALRRAVDEIHWKKTPEGIQLQGWKDDAASTRPRNGRRGAGTVPIERVLEARDAMETAKAHEQRLYQQMLAEAGDDYNKLLGGAEVIEDPAKAAQDYDVELAPGEKLLMYSGGWIIQKEDGAYYVQLIQEERNFPRGAEGLHQAEKFLFEEWAATENDQLVEHLPSAQAWRTANKATYERAQEYGRLRDQAPPRDVIREDIHRIGREMNELLGDRDRAQLTPAEEQRFASLRSRMDILTTEWHENPPSGTKVVDTTEKEDVLSDAIGKAMADKIINDPGQEGVITGEGIVVSDTGMASFYDRIVPNVAKDILKKLGGGKVGKTSIETRPEHDNNFVVRPARGDGRLAPDFADMTDQDRETLAGAAPFVDGEPPLIAGPTAIKIDGEEIQVHIVIASDGVHVIGPGGAFELFADGSELARRWHSQADGGPTQDQALASVISAWDKGRLWERGVMQIISGDLPGAKASTEQPAFDLTPEMKQRAKQGLPMFQSGARGQIKFGDDQTIIGLFEKADRSSFAHETGHLFLEITKDMSTRPEAPEGAKQDWATLQKWLGVEGDEIPVEAHEKFARGFEAYLMTGQAPSTGLRAVFERFRDWLLAIYETVKNLDVEISPEIEGVMARMLTSKATPEQPGMPRPAIEDTPAARKTVDDYRAKIQAGEQLDPVLLDRANSARVVDGNHRLQAMIEEGVPPEYSRVAPEEAITKMGTENWSARRVADELGTRQKAEAPAAPSRGTEPPPPRGSRAVDAAGAEAPPTAELATPLGLEDEGVRRILQSMADNEAGWAQIGGRLDRGRLVEANKKDQGGLAGPQEKDLTKLGLPAFTEWIPKAEWWTGRPDKKMNEAKLKEAVRKALAGEDLRPMEERAIEYLVDVANERLTAAKEVGPTEWTELLGDMKDVGKLEPTTEDVLATDAVARAVELDEAAVERAAIRYDNDDQAFMAEVRRIIGEADANASAPRGGPQGGRAQDEPGGQPAGAKEGPGGQPGGQGEGEGPDAVTREAERFVAENPQRLLSVGEDPAGEPVLMTAEQYLQKARDEAAQAREDAGLFEIAAQCLLGGGRS